MPARLVAYERLDAQDALRTRRLKLGDTSINDKEADAERFDEILERGATGVWEVRNASGMPHNVHPHGVTFTLLENAGAAAAARGQYRPWRSSGEAGVASSGR